MSDLSPAKQLRKAIAGGVIGFFNDKARGQQPIRPSDDALCPRDGVAWRVHADVAGMMVGGAAALLWQMLHPKALAGVWDHSDFRRDRHGRLKRTARFIAVTTYGSTEESEATIARMASVMILMMGLASLTDYPVRTPMMMTVLAICCLWLVEPGRNRANSESSLLREEVTP